VGGPNLQLVVNGSRASALSGAFWVETVGISTSVSPALAARLFRQGVVGPGLHAAAQPVVASTSRQIVQSGGRIVSQSTIQTSRRLISQFDTATIAPNSAVVDNITGKLGGDVISRDYYAKLGSYLEKRGVDLRRGKTSGFKVFEGDKRPALVLRKNATQYEAWHEISHYLDYKKIGKADYLNLPRRVGANIPEQNVFQSLARPGRWERLNPTEQNHAWNYLRERWGMDPSRTFFKLRQQ